MALLLLSIFSIAALLSVLTAAGCYWLFCINPRSERDDESC